VEERRALLSGHLKCRVIFKWNSRLQQISLAQCAGVSVCNHKLSMCREGQDGPGWQGHPGDILDTATLQRLRSQLATEQLELHLQLHWIICLLTRNQFMLPHPAAELASRSPSEWVIITPARSRHYIVLWAHAGKHIYIYIVIYGISFVMRHVCKHAHKSIKLLRDFVLLDFQ